jgi:beta-phosphoglucomutase-like phosphatase (HAD superfamily)
MGNAEIELVIFDCDGVLIVSELISARILIELLAEIGVPVDADYIIAQTYNVDGGNWMS